MLMQKDVRTVLSYIDRTQQKDLVPTHKSASGGMRNLIMRFGYIKLPHTFSAPNDRYFAGTQFYWDSYFTILGLVVTNHTLLARNMVDNLCFLFDKFSLVPARNSWTSLGRSQPPYLTRMAFEIYEHGGADEQWMDKVMTYAEQEYRKVWTNGQRLETTTGLSRYQPKYLGRFFAVFESGWDLSSRFGASSSIIPVDLNCLLYQYESDFLKWAIHKKDKAKVDFWRTAMGARRKLINHYFWDEKTGFYYDYDIKNKRRTSLKTLAGFYPLWCGASTKAQAGGCLKQLDAFEHSGGLASTEALPPSSKQWDYPNGWAPLQFVVIEGLRHYGFAKDATRLTHKWLECNLKVFKQTGKLWEKYNVVECGVGLPGRYPTQPGFGWTNGVFARLTHSLN